MSTRNLTMFLVLLLASAVGLTLRYARPRREPAPHALHRGVANPPSEADSAPPRELSAAIDSPADAERPERMLRLPDGTLLPPLNGVTEPAALSWPPEIPFARVTGKILDSFGYEWYEHADGSHSTTLMLRDELGRLRAFTILGNPIPVVPVVPVGSDDEAR